MLGWGCVDFLQDPCQGPAELHGFRWRILDGVGIDPAEGVVDNDAGSSLSLGDNAQGGYA